MDAPNFSSYYGSGFLLQSKIFEQEWSLIAACASVLVLIFLSTRLTVTGLLIDFAAAFVIFTTAQARMELAGLGTNDGFSQNTFLDYSLDSWLASIVLESRSIYYTLKLNSCSRSVFHPWVHLLGYYITANAGVLILQYCTYIHSFVGETIFQREHVMPMFLFTAGIEVLKIFMQGPLLCKAMNPANLQFPEHKGYLWLWLLRIFLSNILMGINSCMLIEGLSSFREAGCGFELSWEGLHCVLMYGDVFFRVVCGLIFFWCFLLNLSHKTPFVQQILTFHKRFFQQTHRNCNNDQENAFVLYRNDLIPINRIPAGPEINDVIRLPYHEIALFPYLTTAECDHRHLHPVYECIVLPSSLILPMNIHLYDSNALFQYHTTAECDHWHLHPVCECIVLPSNLILSMSVHRQDATPHPTLVCCPSHSYYSQSIASPLVVCASNKQIYKNRRGGNGMCLQFQEETINP